MVRSIMKGLVTFGIILSFLSLEAIGDNSWLNSALNTSNGSDIPSLISPDQGSVVGGSSVTFEWTPIEKPGIAGYVLVYMMGDADNPGNPSTWIKGSFFEIIIPDQTTDSYRMWLQENTQQKPFYWWSIATMNSSGQKGEFPSPSYFSFDNTSPDLSGVELVQPVDATLSTRTPTFAWKVPRVVYQDVNKWILEYAKDVQFIGSRGVIILQENNFFTRFMDNYFIISYTLPSYKALTNGIWYWHITATDVAGNQSIFTLYKSFVINAGNEQPVKVSLKSPSNAFTEAPSRPTFSWYQVQGATSYHLQVDDSNTFSSPEINQDGISALAFMAPSELAPGKYYWRVTSNAPNSEWSDAWSFTIPGDSSPPTVVATTGKPASEQVILEAPFDGAMDMSPTPLFQWKILEGATTYTLEVSTDNLFTNLVVKKINLTATYWGTLSEWEYNNPSELDEGTYYWRVSSDQPNSTSSVWMFTVKKIEEEKPSLSVTVLDIYDNPISGATVTLKSDESLITRDTDVLGSAIFSDLKKGIYILKVKANTYGTYEEQLNIPYPAPIIIKLHRGAVIHGFLYYDDLENPAANVRVTVYDSRSKSEAGSDITDNEGYFIVDNLSHFETYYIVAEGYEDQVTQDIGSVISPRASMDLKIVLRSKEKIIGVIQDKGGSFVPNVKVTLTGDQGQLIDDTNTDNSGSFTFRTIPGRYYIKISVFGCNDYISEVFDVEYNEIKHIGSVTLESMTGVLNIDLRDMNGNSLEGTVTIESAYGNQNSFIVDKSKSITLCSGRYTMTADAVGFLSREISFTIQSGESTQSVELRAEPESCIVIVEDMKGNPIPEAQVSIDDKKIGETDFKGSILISSIIPGDHRFTAEKLGYIPKILKREVVKGEENEVVISLRSGPFYLRFLGFLAQYRWHIGTVVYIFSVVGEIYEYVIKKKGKKLPLWKKILIILSLFPFFIDLIFSRR